MRPGTESSLVRAVLQLLALRGVCAWRCNSGGLSRTDAAGRRRYYKFAGVEGLSDVAGVLPGGRALFVECKRPGRKATVAQAAFLDRMRAQGAVALVVEDVRDLAEVLDALVSG
jgi:hypothetical protein